MTHTENPLSRLKKDDLTCQALDFQQKYDTILGKITTELAELPKNYNQVSPSHKIRNEW